MGEIAIRVQNLGKQFTIGRSEQNKTLAEGLTHAVRAPFRVVAALARGQWRRQRQADNAIWALEDVSFEVKHGEVVGVIGRNGAGKSTLLKILSRITAPTRGQAEIHGRVGSLLEVGTGFHPELTGRENIYLNGAILGMKRVEISRKFDEMVEFSEIGRFIDTPVKQYSSGMYLRLAFAVAAHMEPEILLVDEVLAVGDAAFQKKCLGKMSDVAHQGRTVLFVSHNMAAVSSLCSRVVALKDGRVWADGSTQVIQDYLESLAERPTEGERQSVSPSQKIWITRVWCADRNGQEVPVVMSGQDVSVCLEYRCREPISPPDFALTIYDRLGQGIFYCDSACTPCGPRPARLAERGVVRCAITRLPLVEGSYRINVLVHRNRQAEDHVEGATRMVVEAGDFYRNGRLPPANYAPFLIDHAWQMPDTPDGAAPAERSQPCCGL